MRKFPHRTHRRQFMFLARVLAACVSSAKCAAVATCAVCTVCSVWVSSGPLFAAPIEKLPPAVRKEAEKIRQAVEENFQACTEESMKDLLATCSRQMPGMQEFADEAKTLFDKTDVYMRLADFELLEFRPPHAAARIVQITLPKDEKDKTTGEPKQIFYQERSALLPKWECCEYTQTFRKEDGKWKLYLITTTPKPVEWGGKPKQ